MIGSRDKAAGQPRKPVLGKGLSSLLGDAALQPDPPVNPEEVAASAAPVADRVLTLNIQSIIPNPQQPRKIFDENELNSLAASLKVDGVIQPVTVIESEEPGKYILIAGERRLRASKLAGFETIPAIVKQGNPDDMLRIALIENIQRADLNIVEEAEAYSSLITDYGLTQEQCAQKVGKDRATVANALRILNLPREVQDDLMEGRLTMGHGRALLSLEDKKVILRARDVVIKKQLSVRQTEDLCKTFGKRAGGEAAEVLNRLKDANPDLQYIEESLRSQLRTKVKLSGNGQKGRIEISYFSASELERILGLLGHKFS
jgi:ParB family chromosome partitioning protein